MFPFKKNTKRLAEAGIFLNDHRDEIGLSENTISTIMKKGKKEGWGEFISTGEEDQKSPNLEALRALLLVYLHVGALRGQIHLIRDKAAGWQGGAKTITEIYIDQMKWLLANYRLPEDQRGLRAAAAAQAAVDAKAQQEPTRPWLYGDGKPHNNCPGCCYRAAFYFSFLGGVFSQMWCQQDMTDSCLTNAEKFRETLGLPEHVPLNSDNNLASHPPKILDPGTLVMMWGLEGTILNHMVMSVGQTPDRKETQYVSVHTSTKVEGNPINLLKKQPFPYAVRDGNSFTVNAWLISHSTLIFLGDFFNEKNVSRFVSIAAADPKWSRQLAWER